MLTLQGKRTNNTPSGVDLKLSLTGLTHDSHYVIGDQVAGTLSITPERDLTYPNLTLHLSYVLSSEMNHFETRAFTQQLEKKEKLRKGTATTYDVSIPFHLGRPNFRGHKLTCYWELTVELDYLIPKAQRSMIDKLLANSTEKYTYTFTIPVHYGKGSYRVKARELPIPFLNDQVIGGVFFITAVLMLFLAFPKLGFKSINWLLGGIGILGLLTIISYHIVRLASFKMTPMEINPLRDGKLRIHYLNRGKDHLKGAEIGLRLKEKRQAKNGNGQLDLGEGLLFEERIPLKSSSRPLGHLNEVILPFTDRINEFPTTYMLGSPKHPHGYEWEVFLTTPVPFFGGNKEICWPVQVDWERMRTTPPSTSELEEEKLELLELSENRPERQLSIR